MDFLQKAKNYGSMWGGVLKHYKTGGKVKKSGLAVLHKNEYVLPTGIAPTLTQKKAVAKLKKK